MARAVEGIALGAFGRGRVEHGPGQGEGEEGFNDDGRHQQEGARGCGGSAHHTVDDKCRRRTGCHLGDPVGKEIAAGEFAADEGREGHGRIVVTTGYVTAGKDHDHQDAPDGDGCEVGAAANGEADRGHKEERADELNEVFFHGWVWDEVDPASLPRPVQAARSERLVLVGGWLDPCCRRPVSF